MSNLENLGRKLAAPLIDDHQPPFETVGRWHRQLGRISFVMDQANNPVYRLGKELLPGELQYELSRMVEGAVLLLHWLNVDDPVAEFLAEYKRAAAKHPEMTLDADGHTDESRFYALAEEVGEVAAALTYDNNAATGHNADLITEVTQVGALALAWAARIIEEEGS